MFTTNIMIPFGNFTAQTMQLRRDVLAMASEIGDMKEPLNDSIDKVIIPSIKLNFDQGGRPAWPMLADSTVARRGSAFPILIDSTNLFNEAISKRAWTLTNTEASMTIEGYGQFHQTGTRNMPERPFAVLQERDISAIEEIFDRWVVEMSIRFGRWPG